MTLFLTIFAGCGGILLGYGIVGMRVKVAQDERDRVVTRLSRILNGQDNVSGFSEGSVSGWKEQAREAQELAIQRSREANRLRENIDRMKPFLFEDEPILPELNPIEALKAYGGTHDITYVSDFRKKLEASGKYGK